MMQKTMFENCSTHPDANFFEHRICYTGLDSAVDCKTKRAPWQLNIIQ